MTHKGSFLTGGKVGIVLQCICDRMLANASRTCWNVETLEYWLLLIKE